MIRFTQITANHTGLYALDEDGHVWLYDYTNEPMEENGKHLPPYVWVQLGTKVRTP